jgi:HAMP domain-containing protein
VAIAHRAHRREISLGRRHAAGGAADDRLGDEGRDPVGPEALKLRFELGGEAANEIRLALLAALFAIGEGGRDMAERIRQQRRERLAPSAVAAGGERTERVAVVALPPRDEPRALGLADLEEILPRHFQRALDRLRTAAHQIDAGEAARLVPDQIVGERLSHVGGEEARVHIGELVGLSRQRREHARVPVPETRHGGATGAVEDFAALGVDEPDAVPADCRGRIFAQVAVEQTAAARRRRCRGSAGGHDNASSSTYCDRAASRVSASRRRTRAPSPPSANCAAASACAAAMAPVRLGKNPGGVAASNSSR